MKRIFLVIGLILSLVIVLALSYGNYNNAQEPFHTPAELAFFTSHQVNGPLVPGQWFLPSYSCRGCHGYDSLQQANIDENGNDVNLVRHWESSMMALSAKDPLWRAKVTQEILTNPSHEGDIQDKCTSCHAPTGRYNHSLRGLGPYRLTDLYSDSLGLDGVNCSGCHTIGNSAGATFSGDIPYDTTRHIYGPFQNPMAGPMQLYEGYTPAYSMHTDSSAFCSSCHTLITETIDLAGNYTGSDFVEQATYHEYLNSRYQSQGVKCQTCHMPRLESPVVIANGYIALQPRYPFNQHTFQGANHFMLNLMRSNRSTLGIQVPLSSFDTTIEATAQNLRLNSIDMSVHYDSTSSDTAYFRVRLLNKAGHKFPSGYPSRRAVLQFVVRDAAGDTVFRSGVFDQQFRVTDENTSFEGHHDIIQSQDQSQIYEIVMGDVNYNFTSVLLRAAHLLKDNRIPPVGFTTTHSVYDTTKISADALADSDFNKDGISEGTGIDVVHFHVPLDGVSGQLSVETKFFYQSVPPKWLDEMFQFNDPTIDTFRTMFNNADQTPFLIAGDSMTILAAGLNGVKQSGGVVLSPSASNGIYRLTSSFDQPIQSVKIFDQNGKSIRLFKNLNSSSVPLDVTDAPSGIYYVRIQTGASVIIKKILKY